MPPRVGMPRVASAAAKGPTRAKSGISVVVKGTDGKEHPVEEVAQTEATQEAVERAVVQAQTEDATQNAAQATQPEAAPKRRGGRPKGSKNKPKDGTTAEAAPAPRRARAARASNGNGNGNGVTDAYTIALAVTTSGRKVASVCLRNQQHGTLTIEALDNLVQDAKAALAL